jgi:hypothetical protein
LEIFEQPVKIHSLSFCLPRKSLTKDFTVTSHLKQSHYVVNGLKQCLGSIPTGLQSMNTQAPIFIVKLEKPLVRLVAFAMNAPVAPAFIWKNSRQNERT